MPIRSIVIVTTSLRLRNRGGLNFAPGMAGETRWIKLVLRQVGDKITGTYRCSAVNAQCRNLNETGSINGTAKGNRVNLNIMVLPDAFNCRYTGTLDYNLQRQIVEQGTWAASR